MKKAVSTTVFLFLCFCVSAQEMYVTKFRKSNSIDARLYPKRDINGQKCAIIKVNSALKDLRFDSAYGVTEVEYKVGEYWVYVSPAEVRLDVFAQEYEKLKYSIPESIKALTDYEMVIRVDTRIVKRMEKVLPGFVVVESEPSGADVYIDGKYTGGKTPFEKSLPVGEYAITLKNSWYSDKPTSTVNITEGTTKRKELKFTQPLFGMLKVETGQGVDIHIDNQKVGTATVEKRLMKGTYLIELKREGYFSKRINITIQQGKYENIKEQLEQKKGILEVTSKPSGAKVYIKGNLVGETPFIKRYPVGNHQITLKKKGYTNKQLYAETQAK